VCERAGICPLSRVVEPLASVGAPVSLLSAERPDQESDRGKADLEPQTLQRNLVGETPFWGRKFNRARPFGEAAFVGDRGAHWLLKI
jgi:hypothetical protein